MNDTFKLQIVLLFESALLDGLLIVTAIHWTPPWLTIQPILNGCNVVVKIMFTCMVVNALGYT